MGHSIGLDLRGQSIIMLRGTSNPVRMQKPKLQDKAERSRQEGDEHLPLPKTSSNKEKHAARLQRYHARKAAEKHFGKKAIKGKHVHHRNGNKEDNRKKNLKIIDPRSHGSRHGRGRKGSLTGDIKFSLKQVNKKIWCKK
jgi:hypothetical protein